MESNLVKPCQTNPLFSGGTSGLRMERLCWHQMDVYTRTNGFHGSRLWGLHKTVLKKTSNYQSSHCLIAWHRCIIKFATMQQTSVVAQSNMSGEERSGCSTRSTQGCWHRVPKHSVCGVYAAPLTLFNHPNAAMVNRSYMESLIEMAGRIKGSSNMWFSASYLEHPEIHLEGFWDTLFGASPIWLNPIASTSIPHSFSDRKRDTSVPGVGAVRTRYDHNSSETTILQLKGGLRDILRLYSFLRKLNGFNGLLRKNTLRNMQNTS